MLFGLMNIFMSNGILRIKLTVSGRVHVITHSQDLDELFPENELLRDKNRSLVSLSCLFFPDFMAVCVYFHSSGILMFMSLIFWQPFCFSTFC